MRKFDGLNCAPEYSENDRFLSESQHNFKKIQVEKQN